MIICSVYDETIKKSFTLYSVADAKRKMKEIIKLGHEASGSKTKVWSNGDWENCGEITLTGRNTHFIANTKQTKAGY